MEGLKTVQGFKGFGIGRAQGLRPLAFTRHGASQVCHGLFRRKPQGAVASRLLAVLLRAVLGTFILVRLTGLHPGLRLCVEVLLNKATDSYLHYGWRTTCTCATYQDEYCSPQTTPPNL